MEGTRQLGETPPPAVIQGIVEWLRTEGHESFVSEDLGAHCPAAVGHEKVCAGLLAIAVSREVGEYLLWFRPAVERTIRWAGDPRKGLVYEPGKAPRLSPRGSFELWLEHVGNQSLPWGGWQLEIAQSLRRVILSGVRKRAVELRTLNERLVAADRAKDEFIVTVSHELRTPLNAIVGWTSLLQAGEVPKQRLEHGLDVIARNAKLQTRLVDDLLDVARITAGKLSLELEPHDSARLVSSVIEAVSPSAESKGLRLVGDVDASAGLVLGDPARLRQVVSNLLGNAIKFTPPGGSVEVTLRRSDEMMELSVRDTGQGIDPAFLPHVFESFRQQDQKMNRRTQGLGLGLAIVQRLVALHGGSVWAESEGLGRGACFRLQIPLAPVRPPSSPDDIAAQVDASLSLAGLHILVVEDDLDALESQRQLLQAAGASVAVAPDALTGLALMEEQRFDLVVSDIGLPEVDGLEFMRRLRRRPADQGGKTPAVALTAYTRAIDRTNALKAGFQAHVPKPLDPTELVAVIASLSGRIEEAGPY